MRGPVAGRLPWATPARGHGARAETVQARRGRTTGLQAPQESSAWLLSAYDSRTAGYAIRTISGVGGGPREGTPYPYLLYRCCFLHNMTPISPMSSIVPPAHVATSDGLIIRETSRSDSGSIIGLPLPSSITIPVASTIGRGRTNGRQNTPTPTRRRKPKTTVNQDALIVIQFFIFFSAERSH